MNTNTFSKTILIGYVGRDAAKVIKDDGGAFVASSIGLTEGDKTEWVDIYFNKKIEERALDKFKKGALVLVEGKPKAKVKFKNDSPMATLNISDAIFKIIRNPTLNKE